MKKLLFGLALVMAALSCLGQGGVALRSDGTTPGTNMTFTGVTTNSGSMGVAGTLHLGANAAMIFDNNSAIVSGNNIIYNFTGVFNVQNGVNSIFSSSAAGTSIDQNGIAFLFSTATSRVAYDTNGLNAIDWSQSTNVILNNQTSNSVSANTIATQGYVLLHAGSFSGNANQFGTDANGNTVIFSGAFLTNQNITGSTNFVGTNAAKFLLFGTATSPVMFTNGTTANAMAIGTNGAITFTNQTDTQGVITANMTNGNSGTNMVVVINKAGVPQFGLDASGNMTNLGNHVVGSSLTVNTNIIRLGYTNLNFTTTNFVISGKTNFYYIVLSTNVTAVVSNDFVQNDAVSIFVSNAGTFTWTWPSTNSGGTTLIRPSGASPTQTTNTDIYWINNVGPAYALGYQLGNR